MKLISVCAKIWPNLYKLQKTFKIDRLLTEPMLDRVNIDGFL